MKHRSWWISDTPSDIDSGYETVGFATNWASIAAIKKT